MRRRIRDIERTLERPASGTFSEAELDGLPSPVQRMLATSIAPGTPLAPSGRLSMRGEIKLKKWTPFIGTELISPHQGFVWSVRAGAVSGYDRYACGEGEMRWKLLGLVPVMRADGADVSRSAAGRAAGEAIWVPPALLPHFGVDWQAQDEQRVTARLSVDAQTTSVSYALNEAGLVESCSFQRWGDPDDTGTYDLHPFGMQVAAHQVFAGVTIPSAGVAGWHFGTSRWDEGAFFRFEITDLRLLGS
jgi:hypothetical protein